MQDDHAAYFFEKWSRLQSNPTEFVESVLSDSALWGEDLSSVPGFMQSVKEKLTLLMERGIIKAIQINQTKKVLA